MFALLDVAWASSLLIELMVFAAACVVIFVIFKLGKLLFKVVFGILANSLLGVAIIFVADSVLQMGIPYTVQTLVPTAIFGIPGIGTIILLKLLGVPV